MAEHIEDLLTDAHRLATNGPISIAGQWFARGAAAVAANLPPAARSAAIRAAISELAEDNPTTALHALAAVIRAETDAAIRKGKPAPAY